MATSPTTTALKCQRKQVIDLKCTVQHYAWGKVGGTSKVAQLSGSAPIDPSQPYAELWMGTHSKSPSIAVIDGQDKLLADVLASSDAMRGNLADTSGNLPFLFKVLSINKTLSIQAHPNKVHAEELHARDPEHYPDDNHKPELAVALTDFVGLCGFRPLAEIAAFFSQYPPLQSMLGKEATQPLHLAAATPDTPQTECSLTLKAAFTRLMRLEPSEFLSHYNEIKLAIETKDRSKRSLAETYFLQLASEHPDDIGCFCVFFMNIVELKKGEALLLGPNIPHAYISGDCIECMACSDNVVRAGCTPKFKDVDTLVEMLDYSQASAEQQKFAPVKSLLDDRIQLFQPSFKDFAVASIEISDSQPLQLPALPSASILLCVDATPGTQLVNGSDQVRSLVSGTTLLVGADATPTITSSNGALLFRAYAQ
eukprot:m.57935 g.57935  ORF g.57935 m.57935 type:complete len:425 (-) comp11642_c0_seq2:112-1386(-)